MIIDDAIARYLDHVKSSRSVGTARTYETGLRHFRRHLAAHGLPPEQTDLQHLPLARATDFISWLYNYLLEEVAAGQPEKVSEATKGTYFAAVSNFFEYLVMDAQLLPFTTEQYDRLRKALSKAAKRRPRTELGADKLPSQEIVAALRQQVHQPLSLQPDLPPGERRRQELIHLRNIAIFEALLSSGMRVGELVRLERSHLLYEMKGALVKYAKGKKEREVLFSEAAWQVMQTYLQARQDGTQSRPIAGLPVVRSP